ncbi:hypothetical protein ACLB1N_32990 [Escherichia coli]
MNQQADFRQLRSPFEVVSTSACTPKVKRSRSMFADVMVRVIGVLRISLPYPARISEPGGFKPLRRSLLLLTCPGTPP